MHVEAITRHLAAMGTALTLTVSAPTRERALDASEAAVQAVEAVDGLLSTWREHTPLARLNAAAPGDQKPVTPELFHLLKDLFEWSERSGGTFDPTVAPLVRAWGLRSGGRIPTPQELASARSATGAPLFTFRESSLSLSRVDPAAGIDEGAWGTGWALDRAAEAAREAGATALVLDLGGQVFAFGPETVVSVAHPGDRSRAIATIRLKNASASTSGNSERGLVVNGRRIGHLLDPRTGEPAPDFGSVTVVAPTGLVADILSTAMFVLGPKDGLALSAHLRADGVVHDVLFLIEDEESRTLRVAVSPGMERLVIFAPAPLPLTKKSSQGASP